MNDLRSVLIRQIHGVVLNVRGMATQRECVAEIKCVPNAGRKKNMNMTHVLPKSPFVFTVEAAMHHLAEHAQNFDVKKKF